MAETLTHTAPANIANIAETLTKVLPQPHTLPTDMDHLGVFHVAVPGNFKVETIDAENLLDNPRRTHCTATLTDASSFAAYIGRVAQQRSLVWCDFNPQTFALGFRGVIDEHDREEAGWRSHQAAFTPEMSAEWKLWTSKNLKPMGQVEFAEFIEANADDITAANGMPSSTDMLKMATEFQANEERTLKSTVRLQSGGVRLTYIADPDAGTTESMQMFERFSIGIPVFHGGPAWQITARLKYRLSQGKVLFFFELVRPDRTHQAAALELITQIREAIGAVPLMMGSAK